jgi:hypothetical protein
VLSTTIGKLKLGPEGIGESLTIYLFESKLDWQAFITAWKAEPMNIYITEEL